ncbi:hypothetical protein [Lihuaxuella thermophila]|uniref:Uncharacterized protein n=1 Tax=Lihuaxuella thermophila TaxID=1173111 RepID=A0A1H8CRU8_9BACL|nr:hypothetical protein [Lihuaxuella thermophila]SEM97048.1 hypothetical protein SAMN05444955_10448 [Lihuaxuella thermophila]
MKQFLTLLAKNCGSREIYDPLHEEKYVVSGEENHILITKKEPDQEIVVLRTSESDQAKEKLEQLFERFRTNIFAYLDKVKEDEGTYWRFFDVSFGVDIKVCFSQEENGWQVWMGGDLSLQTKDPVEIQLYIRGLITEFESWWMNEFRKFHQKIKEHLYDQS